LAKRGTGAKRFNVRSVANLLRSPTGRFWPILLKYSISEGPFPIARFSGGVLARWFGDV
jgi:hypothetical protein